jgi:hypothetical protein
MKNSDSLNCEAASTFPCSWLMLVMPVSTTTMSAPREKPICTGTVTSNWRPTTASTSAVVAEAATRPLLSFDQPSSSDRVRRAWNPCAVAKIDWGFGARPPLATINPA